MAISDRTVAVLAEHDYQELELHYPRLRLLEAGATVHVLGTGEDRYLSEKGYGVHADRNVADVDPGDYDAVVIPGGMAPDAMRTDEHLIDLVRALDDAKKPVAWICHAGWVAASADIVRGRRVTSVASIKDDLVNAGAEWVDEEVVVDGHLISSRTPPDLPAFCRTLIGALGG
ncbi:type 1 glutamine amidotransferase [Wenzhouxiangella sp. XN79A]|uniref:type 1 glutamine amidotransferase domain-containing protein n=1 Tax=Wenzhouxiangella sp. XN79A TaxID=2724193 RepID=UPI00144AE1E3|nr:type 1 glutamine amidotransferase domain-containing protein [Wenzhouxiangella sp. XN79A]NKI34282.1 type 1 glutamine amidotransferase [Wenzhouxiangella sp. XN79A]